MPVNRVTEDQIVFQPKPQTKGFKDIEGKEYGRLVVLGYAGKLNGNCSWFVRCTCREIRVIVTYCLTSESGTRSCGCLRKELVSSRRTTHGDTKNLSIHYLFGVWCRIIQRCTDSNVKSFKDYGGRGITVCQRWRESYVAFRDDILNEIGERPQRTSIDREDNDRGYEPGNVRWATSTQQNRNKRNIVMLTVDGITKCIAEWSEYPAANKAATIAWRHRNGWSDKEAVFGQTQSRPMKEAMQSGAIQ